MTALSIVVPCFNEEECLDALHERLTRAAKAAAGSDYELVLINDGSKDRTRDICLSKGVVFVQHQFKSHIDQKNFAVTKGTFIH